MQLIGKFGLTGMTDVKGSAAYVAIERVHGKQGFWPGSPTILADSGGRVFRIGATARSGAIKAMIGRG